MTSKVQIDKNEFTIRHSKILNNHFKSTECLSLGKNERSEILGKDAEVRTKMIQTSLPFIPQVGMILDEKQQNMQNDLKVLQYQLSDSDCKFYDCDKDLTKEATESTHAVSHSNICVRHSKAVQMILCAIVFMNIIMVSATTMFCYVWHSTQSTRIQNEIDIHTTRFHINVTQLTKSSILEMKGVRNVPFKVTQSSVVTIDTNTNTFTVNATGTYELLLTLTLRGDISQSYQASLICIKYFSGENKEFCKKVHLTTDSFMSVDVIDVVSFKENDKFAVTCDNINSIYRNTFLNRLVVKYNK